MKNLALLLIISLSGCASKPFTAREKLLLGAMVAAQAADAHTTQRYIELGGTELNPILGKRPDAGNIWMFKGIIAGGLYGLGELFPDHREGIYTIGIVCGGGAAVWNTYQYERHK